DTHSLPDALPIYSRLRRVVCRHKNDFRGRADLDQLLQDVHAVQLRHHEIEQNDIGALSSNNLDPFNGVRGSEDFEVIQTFKSSTYKFQRVRIVVDRDEPDRCVLSGWHTSRRKE